MRILWFSGAAPWAKTGYGQQSALVVPRLAAMGHEVAVYAGAGLVGAPMLWQGISVLPALQDPQGLDILEDHAVAWKADLIVMLLDAWPRNPALLADIGKRYRLAYWLPIDVDGTDYEPLHPIGPLAGEHMLMTKGRIIPMTSHGEGLCQQAGLDPLKHIPHAVNTSIFTPCGSSGSSQVASAKEHKRAVRKARGVPEDAFIVGINANNGDKTRKGYGEMFQMFAKFRQRHPDAVLMVHAQETTPNGLVLQALADACGIEVYFTNQYAYKAGLIDEKGMADWYRCLDVLLHGSLGEGFGIAAIEAQACGVPVIATGHPPMSDLAGPGWRIACQPWWNPLHHAWWHMPLIDSGVQCLEQAYECGTSARKRRAQQCRDFAMQFDIETVMPRWEDALCELGQPART